MFIVVQNDLMCPQYDLIPSIPARSPGIGVGLGSWRVGLGGGETGQTFRDRGQSWKLEGGSWKRGGRPVQDLQDLELVSGPRTSTL